MIKNNSWRAILALSIVCCMLCSGCITSNGNEPPSVYTFPKYAHQLQEQIEEWGTACDVASAEWQRALETFRTLAEAPDSTKDELYQAFTEYDAAIREYERVLARYHTALLLSEHTEPTESGLLALKKEAVPFDRTDGSTYPYEMLNMAAQGYMTHEGEIKRLIASIIGGEEGHQEILDAIDRTEGYLPEYYDVVIGYVYYEMNQYLTCLSHYSDGMDTSDCRTTLIL